MIFHQDYLTFPDSLLLRNILSNSFIKKPTYYIFRIPQRLLNFSIFDDNDEGFTIFIFCIVSGSPNHSQNLSLG